jgi:hypothetical protein
MVSYALLGFDQIFRINWGLTHTLILPDGCTNASINPVSGDLGNSELDAILRCLDFCCL